MSPSLPVHSTRTCLCPPPQHTQSRDHNKCLWTHLGNTATSGSRHHRGSGGPSLPTAWGPVQAHPLTGLSWTSRKGSPAQHSVLSPSTTSQSIPGGAGNPLRLLQGSTAQSEAPQPAAARGASEPPHSCKQEDQALTLDPEPAFFFSGTERGRGVPGTCSEPPESPTNPLYGFLSDS